MIDRKSASRQRTAEKSQLEYIHERTRVYNDFRAIREDIFLKMKGNVLDSLDGAKLEIATLNSKLTEHSFQIETLNADLKRTKNDRDEAIRNKDSLSFLGIQLNKALYNTIMWFIILGFAVLATILFLLFKRTHMVTVQTKKQLEIFSNDNKNNQQRRSAGQIGQTPNSDCRGYHRQRRDPTFAQASQQEAHDSDNQKTG